MRTLTQLVNDAQMSAAAGRDWFCVDRVEHGMLLSGGAAAMVGPDNTLSVMPVDVTTSPSFTTAELNQSVTIDGTRIRLLRLYVDRDEEWARYTVPLDPWWSQPGGPTSALRPEHFERAVEE